MPGVARSLSSDQSDNFAGLIGASLLSLNFVLAARVRWLEEVMNGLPRIYSAHHRIGAFALMFLLAHPLFLSLQYLPTPLPLAASFLTPGLDEMSRLLGVLALLSLVTLLVITFFIRIPYHQWKATHRWLGLPLLLASVHVYLIPGNLSAAPHLRAYMVSVLAVGVVAFAYRVPLGRWLVRRYPYKVRSVQRHNTAVEAQLVPTVGRSDTRRASFSSCAYRAPVA